MAVFNSLILVACARAAVAVAACCNLGAGPFTVSTASYVVKLFTS